MGTKVVRIGCGSGFWGDTPEGAHQLITYGGIDYLMLDYLAEVTMSILAKAKSKDPSLGYAPDFLSQVVRPYAKALQDKKIKVIVNAGGVNPASCVKELIDEFEKQGVCLKVAAVLGDDLMARADEWRRQGVKEMFTGQCLPQELISANAYLGAFPIARALSEGADIVVTGRCVDSALALGPLIHEYGWTCEDADLLAAGSLVGHVLECGPQCTGGFSSDWKESRETWATIGFPIAECSADGSFVVTKPPGTGGVVNAKTVTEQITYETGDPRAYLLPDVSCDWSQVQVEQVGDDRVKVEGAVGHLPTPTYKVSATYADGYRCLATLLIRGREAADKGQSVADAILARTRNIFQRQNLGDYSEVSVELIGAEQAYGTRAKTQHTREVMLKIAVRHADRRALDIFSREIYPASTGTVQGIAGVFGGRPKVQPMVRLFSLLHPKRDTRVSIQIDKRTIDVPAASSQSQIPNVLPEEVPRAKKTAQTNVQEVKVPLDTVAYARSGDKGNMSNIAVIARRPEFVDVLRDQLTPEAVADHFAQLADGPIRRFEWPGLNGFNFLIDNALGGGGAASLRYDPQGKAHAEILLDFEVSVPWQWL